MLSMRVEQGDVRFKGADLTAMSRPELDRLRGDRIAFVPQNPTTALNPGMRVGRQLTETLLAHGRAQERGRMPAPSRASSSWSGCRPIRRFQRRYPHQLSGGQQQRVCIAMALACDPDLLVLDEPTTGLDVTTQEQIIALLSDLRGRIGMAMLYVTHDLALLAQIADRIGVMYAGRMVEIAPTDEIFLRPRHPYTQGLIASIPSHRRPVRVDAPARCAACCGGRNCRPAVRSRRAAITRWNGAWPSGRNWNRSTMRAPSPAGAGRRLRRFPREPTVSG